MSLNLKFVFVLVLVFVLLVVTTGATAFGLVDGLDDGVGDTFQFFLFGFETPLQLAEALIREGAADDTVSDDEGTKRMYIAGLLRDAGGVI